DPAATVFPVLAREHDVQGGADHRDVQQRAPGHSGAASARIRSPSTYPGRARAKAAWACRHLSEPVRVVPPMPPGSSGRSARCSGANKAALVDADLRTRGLRSRIRLRGRLGTSERRGALKAAPVDAEPQDARTPFVQPSAPPT